MLIATTKATGCSSWSESPRAWKAGSIRCATAGSPIAPRPREATVMPSCAPAITRETFSMARSVVRAMRDPAAARGSIWVRRAEMRANSDPTKNALAARRASATRTAERSLIGCLLHGGGPRGQREPVDPQPVEALHDDDGFLRLEGLTLLVDADRELHDDLVARLGHPAEHLQEQSRHGVVVVVLGQGDPRSRGHFVGAQQARDGPGAVAPLADS